MVDPAGKVVNFTAARDGTAKGKPPEKAADHDKDKQDDVQKLVLEITIEGIPNYYIISLRELNAGRIYTVKNITINGYGSEYPNFYEKKYDAEISGFEIEGWTITEIDNIDVGYTSDGISIY